MAPPFELACGSVVGRGHVGSGNLLSGKACQDAIGFAHSDDCMVACVHDGCSSAQYAEVGARTGSEIVADCVLAAAKAGEIRSSGEPEAIDTSWARIHSRILRRMYLQTQAISGAPTARDPKFIKAVRRYMQFTTLGVVITPAETTVFSVGDGVFAVNGEILEIPPYPGNAPPYLCYDLLDGFAHMKAILKFNLRRVLPTSELQSVLIGTDGVGELIAKADRNIPGKKKLVGPLEQLWLENRFFAPDLYETIHLPDGGTEQGKLVETLTPWLCGINSEVVKMGEDAATGQPVLKREPGLIQDDAAIMVLRRKKD